MTQQLSKRNSKLPAKIEDLGRFVLVGREKLTAVRAAIRAIDKVGVAKEVREQKLTEGQDLAGAVLDAEARLGELLKEIPDKKAASGGGSRSLPDGISHKLSHYCQKLADHKDIIEETEAEAKDTGSIPTRADVFKKIKETDKAKKSRKAEVDLNRERKKTLSAPMDNCDLRVCSCEALFSSGIKPDAVITDPPYPEEFLPVFSELAKSCSLAKVPLVAVMSGQSYLPEVMQRLCQYLRYRWTLAYLTPGGQAVQQWTAKVNTFWKPVLLFGESSEWFGDVAASKVNDNDKRYHGWGQSESGMADLIERLTKPGQLVCDPFLGGGTTAIACLAMGRRFVGCDVDEDCVEKTRQRIGTIHD